MIKNLYIDIETIPSGDKIDPATMNPPSQMKKEDTIAKWYAEEAPRAAEEQYLKRALKSMEGEILCVGWAIDDGDVYSFMRYEEEHKFMLGLEDCLREALDKFDSLIWIGHNILTFDMPWIWRRCIKYGCRWLANQIRLDRYKGNIQDTMRIWAGADYQDYTSLNDLARWLGVGEQIGSGSEVYGLYLAGKMDEISEHCSGDVELVRKVYKRIVEGE